jgi:hypothetical protein
VETDTKKRRGKRAEKKKKKKKKKKQDITKDRMRSRNKIRLPDSWSSFFPDYQREIEGSRYGYWTRNPNVGDYQNEENCAHSLATTSWAT